jgi:hypothetical protein
MRKKQFAPRAPAHRIYQMIFETKQDANTPIGLFIAQKRALLAQVTPPDSESRQLDFLYGLLRQEIKDKIPRTSIATFCELLAKARDVEGTLQRERRRKLGPTTKTDAIDVSIATTSITQRKIVEKRLNEPHNKQPNPKMWSSLETIQTSPATDTATQG